MKPAIAFAMLCALPLGAAPGPKLFSSAHIDLPDMRLEHTFVAPKPFTVRSYTLHAGEIPRGVSGDEMSQLGFGRFRSDRTDLYLAPREQEKVIRDLRQLMAQPQTAPTAARLPQLSPPSGVSR